MYDSLDIQEIDSFTACQNLIDIRDKYQYLLGHLPNARNIPYTYLIMMPENYLQKEEIYYLYCDHGEKSRKICAHLQELGYHAIDLVGGYESYQRMKESPENKNNEIE